MAKTAKKKAPAKKTASAGKASKKGAVKKAASKKAAPKKKKKVSGSTVTYEAKKAAPKKAAPKKAVPKKAAPKAEKVAQQTYGTPAMVAANKIRLVAGHNPRSKKITPLAIETLRDNIKKDGLLSRLVVRPTVEKNGAVKEGFFDLVSGERRFRALKHLGWSEIPVDIRHDLAGDDDRSRALAVAENSDDTRDGLNAVEMGRVFIDLKSKGWSVKRISSECGVHDRKVRRALELAAAPEEIQKRVENGEYSARVAGALVSFDSKTRAQIMPELKEIQKKNLKVTEKTVREIAKASAKQSGVVAEPGGTANKKQGAARARNLVTWKGSKEKQSCIPEICFYLDAATEKEKGTQEYGELRGAAAWALWDRGDLDSFWPPVEDLKGSDDPELDEKALEEFNSFVAAEAEKYDPKDEEIEFNEDDVSEELDLDEDDEDFDDEDFDEDDEADEDEE